MEAVDTQTPFSVAEIILDRIKNLQGIMPKPGDLDQGQARETHQHVGGPEQRIVEPKTT